MVAKQLVQRPISWADCVGIARLKFEKYFRHKVSSGSNKVGSHGNLRWVVMVTRWVVVVTKWVVVVERWVGT